jgi:cellulose synthase/poly-beta-1,6-N-acetylglucosamine synthase-like glycosyltransferase
VETAPPVAGLSRHSTRRRRLAASIGAHTTTGQVVLSLLAGLGLPYLVLELCGQDALSVAPRVFLGLVAAFLATAYLVMMEHLYALQSLDPKAGPPPVPDGVPPFPAATAIIAAYLPNESAIVATTVRQFLRTRYEGDLQVILAYNTPQDLPVEDTLRAIAAEDSRLTLVRVDGSTSKAENVNAALDIATGEFVGVFDADHHPAPDAFSRAARWLAAGYDVVQGHCAVRNGHASRLSRTVAVEFESMYAITHPGRARIAGFGIFGGSNGYWRTSLLRRIQMRPTMLTEDIDSTIRALLQGARITSDPGLLSYELAPATFRPLVRQRLRWAQGWSQVARQHLGAALRSPALSSRQKIGMLYLFGWGEVYPWISLAVYSILLFAVLHPGTHMGLRNDTGYVLGALIMFATGPVQAAFAYAVAAPELRRRRGWFVWYMLACSPYTEFKNALVRVALLKELIGEFRWHITPREDLAPQALPAHDGLCLDDEGTAA